jgi:TonB-linked SusC/RagA family outer membrane protein
MPKKYYLWILFLLLSTGFFNPLIAGINSSDTVQNILQNNVNLSGVVMDNYNESVIGAILTVNGTQQGTTTDLNGRYVLSNVPPNAVITVKSLGMKPQEIAVNGKSVINIFMEEESIGMKEIVVVGYGTQKKVNLTGAVSNMKIDEQLTGRSLPNVSLALQGKLPGLAISQSSGMAGDKGVTMLIRGMGTVNNASPLVVVDGMPDIDINRLNIEDVESISILKDASSAAVYGSRAANGVILITTKSGSGYKPKINASSSLTLGVPTHAWSFMNDYPRALTLLQRDEAVNVSPENMRYKNGTVDQWMALGMIDPRLYPNTDWYDVILRDGMIQKYNVSSSGGNDVSNYYISVGVMDENGMIMNNDYTQYNARINYEAKVRENLKVGARFSGNWSEMQYAQDASYQSSVDANQMRFAIAGMLPYDPETSYYGGTMAYGENSQAFNPYSMYTNQLTHKERQEANGSMFLDWKLFKGLNAHVDYTLNYYNDFRYSAHIPTDAYNFQTGLVTRAYVEKSAGVENHTTNGYKTQFSGRLNYEFNIGENHNLAATAVYSREYWHTRYQYSKALDRIHYSLEEIDGTLKRPEGLAVAGNSSAEGLISYIGRLNYAAYQRYLLEVNLRADGSSKFLEGYRYGYFPSASVGWIFTEESFINSWINSWLYHGKFRASYGTLGNNNGVGRYEQLEVLNSALYMIDGEIEKGLVNKKMINKDFSWEETSVMNMGLDLAFFRNQLAVEIDYYDRLTTGMHRPSDMSIHLTGAYNAPRKNIGNLRNRGIEGNLTWRDKKGDFNYTINLNAAYNTTTLEKWNEYLGRNMSDPNNSNLVFLNMPYSYVYAYEAIGIAQTWNDVYSATPQGARPGDLLYKDLNGDGRIDDNDMRAYPRIQENRPTTNFALNSSFQWKGFDLALMLQGAAGRKTFWLTGNNNPDLSSDGRQAITAEHWTEPWSLENRDGTWTRIGGANNRKNSTFYLDNLAYVRLKNVQIGYNIPSGLTQKAGISAFRIFFSTDNLLTISDFRGLDPEKNDVNDGYPLMKSFTFGFNIEL